MGLLRYIVQGFGWEIGAHAAREGIDALERSREVPRKPTWRERLRARREERARRKAAARARKEREAAIARNEAKIESELSALKKKV